jgi:UDP-N-acetylmuramoylalanine--D-glutamate ligase
VLVLGFARQGRALARWLPTLGARVVVNGRRLWTTWTPIYRSSPMWNLCWGDHPLSLLDNADLVCISGGVVTLPIVQEAIGRNITVTNDAQLFLERCPAPVIGITGSAGKTTTTTLVGEIIKKAGYTTWVGEMSAMCCWM